MAHRTKTLQVSILTAGAIFSTTVSSLIKSKRDTLAMLIDYERVKDADTIVLKTMYANLNISGNGNTSKLKLLSISSYVRKSEKGDHKKLAVELFEKFTLKKISAAWR
jgi:hypothetical protein